MSGELPKARVFMSYSWTNEEHKDWVRMLSERLQSNGVDVVLDQWELNVGHDKFKYMERMVNDESVTKVLLICDRVYAEKANGRMGGVGTETLIVSPQVYGEVLQTKFIPIIREMKDDGTAWVPTYIEGCKYINFSNEDDFEDSYDQLLRVIYGKPLYKKPPLGSAPKYLTEDGAVVIRTAGTFRRFKDAAEKNKSHAHATLEEYLEEFLVALEGFRLERTTQSPEEFGQVFLQNIGNFVPYRDEFIECMDRVSRYLNDAESYDRIHQFLERLLTFKEFRAQSGSSFVSSRDNYRFMIYELFLYFIASLIRNNRFEVASRFIESSYHYEAERRGGFTQEGIEAFREPLELLDKVRVKRDGNDVTLSLHGLIAERATLPKYPIRDISQIDMLLFIRRYFPDPGAASWYPRLLILLSRMGPLPLFARATTSHGFLSLKHLLKVDSIMQLAVCLHKMTSDQHFKQVWVSPYFIRGAQPEELFNLQEIYRIAQEGNA